MPGVGVEGKGQRKAIAGEKDVTSKVNTELSRSGGGKVVLSGGETHVEKMGA